MSATENPYHPPLAEPGVADRLVFNGVTDEADYRELLMVSGLERVGWFFFESPLLIIIVPSVLTAVVHKSLDGYTWQLPITSLTFLLMAAVLFFLQRSYSRRAIAARQVKLYPDLLGVAQGELTSDGLLLYDGVHHYWFGPSHLGNCTVSRVGVRFQVDANQYRFVPLTARIFAAFDLGVAKRLHRVWSQSIHQGKTPDMTLWSRLGDAPDDAIHFRFEGWDSHGLDLPTGELSSVWNLLGYIALTLSVIAILNHQEAGQWIFMGFLAAWGFWLVVRVALTRNALRKWQPKTITQCSWITANELATFNNHSGMRVPTHKLGLAVQSENVITGTLHSQPMQIDRSMLIDPNEWQRLCDLVTATSRDISTRRD